MRRIIIRVTLRLRNQILAGLDGKVARMNATLVGADRLGNIPAVLETHGIRILQHISGRFATQQRRTSLPRGTQLLILFTDFLSHNCMRSFRAAAAEAGVPVLACRRSASCLQQSLTRQRLRFDQG